MHGGCKWLRGFKVGTCCASLVSPGPVALEQHQDAPGRTPASVNLSLGKQLGATKNSEKGFAF